MKIVKKDGTLSEYNDAKIINAISKSAERVLVKFTDEEIPEGFSRADFEYATRSNQGSLNKKR